MKKAVVLGLFLAVIIIAGCDMSHNFMDVDNPNAKDDLKNIIGSGNIPQINSDDFGSGSLSGTRGTVKGYANKYLEGSMSGYVDKAKEGLSGAKETVKGYYNDGVDEITRMVNDKVTGAISGELNKFKIQ